MRAFHQVIVQRAQRNELGPGPGGKRERRRADDRKLASAIDRHSGGSLRDHERKRLGGKRGIAFQDRVDGPYALRSEGVSGQGQEHDRGDIVIDDFDRDIRKRKTRVAGGTRRRDAVLDECEAGVFRRCVVYGLHKDGLRLVPIGGGEMQFDRTGRRRVIERGVRRVGVDLNRARAGLLVLQRGNGCRDRHINAAHRRCCQDHGVTVDSQPDAKVRLGYGRGPARLRNDRAGRIVVRDVDRYADDRDARIGYVARYDDIADDTAVALQVAANDRPRLAADIERVAAQVAEDVSDHARRRPLHADMIVTLGTVDLDFFYPDILYEQAGTVDARRSNDNMVAELGAHHDNRVTPVATVDCHRSVDAVFDIVRPKTGIDVGAGPVRIDRLGSIERKRAHHKPVVAVFAKQAERSLVAENDELVIAITTVDGGRCLHARREVTLGGMNGRYFVARGDGAQRGVAIGQDKGSRNALGLEHLPDLESVGTLTTVNRHRRAGVVESEVVITGAGIDGDARVHRSVIVDPLGG